MGAANSDLAQLQSPHATAQDALRAWREKSTFYQTVIVCNALYFVRRLASIDSNGMPSEQILHDPLYNFAQSVCDHLSRVESAITDGDSLIHQVQTPPPEAWLHQMDLTDSGYRQQLLDLFTIVIHSVLDRTLLLVNVVYNLNLSPRACIFRNIRDALTPTRRILLEQLGKLEQVIEPLFEPRNLIAHRGENRQVPLFSNLRWFKALSVAVGIPLSGVRLSDDGAIDKLLLAMRDDLTSMAAILFPTLDCMADQFIARCRQLGGPPMPSDEENRRYTEVLSYFRGGPRPDFLQQRC